LVLFALLAAVTLPLLVFKMPAMADYPNHLARIYAIASLDHDPCWRAITRSTGASSRTSPST
jgi:hypothetical protein